MFKQKYEPANEPGIQSTERGKKSFWRRGPITGILSLILGSLAAASTLIVLVTSNGVAPQHWRVAGYDVQPTVVLSILSTVTNVLLYYAFDVGMTVSWWVEAQSGTTLGALHRYWNHWQSHITVFLAGRHLFSRAAMASLFMFLLLADGPLLQRASSVGVATRHEANVLHAAVSPSPLITGTTALYTDHELNPTLYTPLFANVLQQYNNRQPITVPGLGCQGNCEFELVAPGWDISCKNWTSPFSLMTTAALEQAEAAALKSNSTNSTIAGSIQTVFWSNVTFGGTAAEMYEQLEAWRTSSKPVYPTLEVFQGNPILLSSMVKADPGVNGSFAWRSCIVQEALSTYPLKAVNDTLLMQPMPWNQNFTKTLVYRSQEEGSIKDWPSTNGGMYLALSQLYQSHAKIIKVGGWNAVRPHGNAALTYLRSPDVEDMSTDKVTWADPIDDAISMLQELTLRTAIAATTGKVQWPTYGMAGNQHPELTATQPNIFFPNLTDVNRTLSQHTIATMEYQEPVYLSHYGWLGGALAIMALAVVTTIPLYARWWTLGRPVSMNPLAVATAFNAPLLRSKLSSTNVDEVIRGVGGIAVKYGPDGFYESDGRQLSSMDYSTAYKGPEESVISRRSGSP